MPQACNHTQDSTSSARPAGLTSDPRLDSPSPKQRSLNNKLHQLALLSPDKFAAVEAFVDQALTDADCPPFGGLGRVHAAEKVGVR